ncbi:MAG: tRNA dihydrouridine synthase DusB [Lachnospiraceae bacterium]|nr:tRNA dihydrouridine synthase DusB [Lachnospiraceae bacterium]
MTFAIGNVKMDNPLVLGPMAGVTDLPFRLLCKEMGCGLMYTEMISAKALYYKNKNTLPLLATDSKERPVAVQLFGSETQLMADMAKTLEGKGYQMIDINMGCPVPKIVNNREGSALMKNPKLAGEIIETMAKAVSLPVTVKIRKGFDKNTVNAVEIARIAQESGASAVAVHGRTREEYYSGKADWDIIRQVKEAVSIPVIGSGDITDVDSFLKMREQTGCDGYMIARGAKGNPWVFKEILTYLKTGIRLEKPSLMEVLEMIRRHGKMMVEFKGEYTGIREMRKHLAWYTAGYPGSARLRGRVNEMETYEDLVRLLEEYEEWAK